MLRRTYPPIDQLMREQFFQLQKQIAAAKSAPFLSKAPLIEASVDKCCALMGVMIERIERLEENEQAAQE